MNKSNILYGVGGLLIGLAVGFFVANSINTDAAKTAGVSLNPNSQQVDPQINPQTNGKRPSGGMQADVQKTLDKAANEPDNYEAQIAAGKMHVKIERFDKAIDYFQIAQKLKPEEFESNAQLGNAYFGVKDFVNAAIYYEKALQIKPDEINVQSDYATTFFKRIDPDYERAIKEFEKALEIDPKHEVSLFNMALAYLTMKDKQNATKTLDRLKAVNPQSLLIPRLDTSINRN